jgi:hypothetical protein
MHVSLINKYYRIPKKAMKNGQFTETGNIGYTRRRKSKQKTQHNMCWTQLWVDLYLVTAKRVRIHLARCIFTIQCEKGEGAKFA